MDGIGKIWMIGEFSGLAVIDSEVWQELASNAALGKIRMRYQVHRSHDEYRF